MDMPFVTGFWRYTDIFFQWPSVCNEEDRDVLKAISAHDALVNEQHPLHIDGVEGVQLYIGKLKSNDKNRSLFSSKQVEYIRYWLHAMVLTKDLLPLPYSNCLLREEDLLSVLPRNYRTGEGLKSVHQKNPLRVRQAGT
ncbi:hypothetical protein GYMLUDRAFT_47164 [Collybiopsis luxurians FD-317 M1]|uniref:Uncharacterized protein n=1 Tax=Collybiopsis luxurians FD-317 M1 TaxID=944289 RepID=A0A0D0CMF4_9AGAR|nr:hypothetical protein GYMLUDRAFT_47164 [Collybiopsis luxurians FD-317 M1]